MKRVNLPPTTTRDKFKLNRCFAELRYVCEIFNSQSCLDVNPEFCREVGYLATSNGWEFFSGSSCKRLNIKILGEYLKVPILDYLRSLNGFSIDGRSSVYSRDVSDLKDIISLCSKKQTEDGSSWSPTKLVERRNKYGHHAYNLTLEQVQAELDPTKWGSASKIVFDTEMEVARQNVGKYLRQFERLKSLESRLWENHQIRPIRGQWLNAFTATCEHWSIANGSYKGCGTCNGCFDRWCQTFMLIKSASGVADTTVVMHFGAVFRSQEFRGFGIRDWANLEYWEYASMAKSCSCHFQNAYFVLPVLRKICHDWKLPTTLEDMMRFFGISMKSAVLILHAAFGVEYGIACDRHLKRLFHRLEWITKATTNETKIAITVMQWLDQDKWSDVNNLLAGFGQLAAITEPVVNAGDSTTKSDWKYRGLMVDCAKELDLTDTTKKIGDVSLEDTVNLFFT